jgi:hypothetical protein
MLERALEIRTGLDAMAGIELDLKQHKLSNDDWHVIKLVTKFLEPFANVTKEIEGLKHPTLNVVIPLYNSLIDHVEDWIDEENCLLNNEGRKTCEEIIAGARVAKEKLLKYYNKTAEVYIVPVVLDPRLKLNYFDAQEWGSFLETEVKAAYVLFQSNILHSLQSIFKIISLSRAWERYQPSPEPAASEPNENKVATCSVFSKLQDRVRKHQTKDELQSYLALGPEEAPDDDILKYWKLNSMKWPRLASMAKDYLAPYASSASSERPISTGRDLISFNSHSYLPETMEVNMRLRSWFRSGLKFKTKVE